MTNEKTIPPTSTPNICTNEARIIKLEEKINYKDERIDQLIDDNYHIRKDINALTISVTELSNTLRIREEDTANVRKLEQDFARLESSWQTFKYIIPIICTLLSLGIQIFLK